MIEILQKIPSAYIPLASALAALIGAGLALVGIVIGALLKNRLDKRLAHEQRVMSLRKEIFLEAAAALSVNESYLLAFSKLEDSIKDISKDKNIDGHQLAFGKMYLVASNKTIEAVTKANIFISQSIMSLSANRAHILMLKDLHVAAKAATETSADVAAKQIHFHEEYLDHVNLCAKLTNDAGMLVSDAIICMRKELDTLRQPAFDPGRFKLHLENGNQSMVDYIKGFTDNMRIVKDLENSEHTATR